MAAASSAGFPAVAGGRARGRAVLLAAWFGKNPSVDDETRRTARICALLAVPATAFLAIWGIRGAASGDFDAETVIALVGAACGAYGVSRTWNIAKPS
jgi:hypothetical protein